MKKVGSYEAKTHLPRLLDEVAGGRRLCITKKGVPVAILAPAVREAVRDPRRTIEKIRSFRKANALGGASLRKMIERGRRS